MFSRELKCGDRVFDKCYRFRKGTVTGIRHSIDFTYVIVMFDDGKFSEYSNNEYTWLSRYVGHLQLISPLEQLASL